MKEKVRQEIRNSNRCVYVPLEAACALRPLLGGYNAHWGLESGYSGLPPAYQAALGLERFEVTPDEFGQRRFDWGAACRSLVGVNPWEGPWVILSRSSGVRVEFTLMAESTIEAEIAGGWEILSRFEAEAEAEAELYRLLERRLS